MEFGEMKTDLKNKEQIKFQKVFKKSLSHSEITFENISDHERPSSAVQAEIANTKMPKTLIFETKNKSSFLLKIVRFLSEKIENFQWPANFVEFLLMNIYAMCFLILLIQLHLYSEHYFFCNKDLSNFILSRQENGFRARLLWIFCILCM